MEQSSVPRESRVLAYVDREIVESLKDFRGMLVGGRQTPKPTVSEPSNGSKK